MDITHGRVTPGLDSTRSSRSESVPRARIPLTTRTEALTQPCPYCGASPGSSCMGLRRPRLACHLERHLLAGRPIHKESGLDQADHDAEVHADPRPKKGGALPRIH